MGPFDSRGIRCPANEWTRIISHFGRGYRQTLKVVIRALDGAELRGEYRERRFFWIFPEEPSSGPLLPEMTFVRYWINGIYRVDIRPQQDCVVTIG